MSKAQPFIWFDGQLREAVDFYASLFADGEVLDTSDYPPGVPGKEGDLLTATLRIGEQDIVFLNGGPQYKLNPSFSIMIRCVDQDEIDRLWDALGEGGEELQCGWITDQYGLTWQIVPERLGELLGDPDRDRANRAMQAMLQMIKLDSAALQAAADGV